MFNSSGLVINSSSITQQTPEQPIVYVYDLTTNTYVFSQQQQNTPEQPVSDNKWNYLLQR